MAAGIGQARGYAQPVAEHSEAVERAFTQQARAFEDPEFNQLFTVDSDWLFERLELAPDDLVLDVAAGTGHVARGFAPKVRAVVAVDVTKAMLERGWIEAKRAALRNVVFMQADAAALPFVDGSFDVVVSRFALHHFEDPAVQVAEMRRVLRPGGRLAVADLICDPEPATADTQNRLERLRDPSHTRMLPLDELAGLVGATDVEFRDVERSLEPWLAQARTDPAAADEIRAALRADLAGGPPTGFRPRDVGGDPRFLHTMASVIAAGTLLPGP
jgi:ubiquinone/menaquinone biosynthesis C-methylase UbiE